MSSRYDEFTTFLITGIPSVGNTLSITEDTPDPDGTGTLSYSWQSSSDNSTWSQVSTSSTYTLTSAEEGKYIKAVISYTDDEGFLETVTTDSLYVIPHAFTNRGGLKTAVDLWISDESTALNTYGHISNWDVSQVTDFSALLDFDITIPIGIPTTTHTNVETEIIATVAMQFSHIPK